METSPPVVTPKSHRHRLRDQRQRIGRQPVGRDPSLRRHRRPPGLELGPREGRPERSPGIRWTVYLQHARCVGAAERRRATRPRLLPARQPVARPARHEPKRGGRAILELGSRPRSRHRQVAPLVVAQGVHHDLWDRDMPAQPTLIDLEIGGAKVPALVQPTKQGEVYVLDRRSEPRSCPSARPRSPASTLPDEHVSPTQPTSALSFMPTPLRQQEHVGRDAVRSARLQDRVRVDGLPGARPRPPATHETLTYPSNLGVFDWGGVAVDPVRQALVGVPVHMAFTYSWCRGRRPRSTS